MKNNKLISEAAKIDAEILEVSTAASSSSLNYDMRDYGQALVNVCVESTAGFSTVSIDLMESSAATVAGSSAAGSKAGMVLGGASTLLSTAGGARKITLTFSSASTANQFFTLKTGTLSKKFTYTTSTALNTATAQSATNLYFGSTVGSTVNTGIALSLDALATAINSTLAFGPALICSTLSTASITIQAADAAIGNLGLSASAVMTGAVNQAVGAFNITDDALTSTANKRYIGVKVSSAADPTRAAVTVIRTGGSYMPPVFSGKLST